MREKREREEVKGKVREVKKKEDGDEEEDREGK